MKPLSLEQLIGGPLRALVLAQGISAQATAQFISEVGFLPPEREEKDPRARTIAFTYVHPAPDPANPGAVLDTPVRVNVPLLALTAIPQIRVAEATITLNTSIVDVRQVEKKPEELSFERKTDSGLDPPVRLFAMYSQPGKPGAPGAGLSLTIRVENEPMTEGLHKIIGLLQDAINGKPMKT